MMRLSAHGIDEFLDKSTNLAIDLFNGLKYNTCEVKPSI